MRSSRYALHPSIPRITAFVMHWNVAGAFFMPNGITAYWKRPSGVAKADRDFVLSVSGTYQYPLSRLHFVTYFAFPMRSMISLIWGKGNKSLLVTAFSFLKSVQRQKVPSGFGTRIHGEHQSLLLGSMMLFKSMYSMSAQRCYSFSGFIL